LLVLTNLISIAFLVWALHDANLGELWDDLTSMDWTWVAIGVVTDVLVYFLQAWRWCLLLRPVTLVTFWDSLRAVYVGLFGNAVLPFRAGELIRCYLLGRWSSLPFSVVLSSALIERIFDGVCLIACLVVTLRITPLPKNLRYLVDGSYILGVVVLGAAILFGLAMFRRRQTRSALSGKGWQRRLRVLIDDLNLIGHSRYLYFAGFVSVPYLLLQVVPVYAVLRGYGFDLSMEAAFVLMVILRLGSAVPQAPGNIGLFQLLTKVTLQDIFHVVPAEAARFSLVLWGVVTLPLLLGGFLALALTGGRLGEIHQEARSGMEPKTAS
jgi:uncharacterized protein (TIRG00374 family)